MTNPTLPTISNAEALTLASGPADDNTGISFLPFLVNSNDSPPVHTLLQQQVTRLLTLLAGPNQGRVVDLGGRNVGVFALKYQIGGTEYNYVGDATLALTASKTTYLYLDTDETLKTSESAWPAGDHVKLGIAVTDASDITSLEDSRFKNLQVGAISNWWAFTPSAAVNLGDQQLNQILRLKLSDPTDVALDAAGKVDPPSVGWIRVDTNGAASSDDFVGLTGAWSSTYGTILLVSSKDAARVVTVKAAGDFALTNGDCVLDDPDKILALIANDGGYAELFRSDIAPALLKQDLDCQQFGLLNFDVLRWGTREDLTIAAGAVTKTKNRIELLNETGDPTDDLDTISGGTSGDVIFVQARSGGQVPTVKHGTGNIQLANDRDFTLASTNHMLVLFYDGTNWVEASRSHWSIFDLTGTGKGIRWEHPFVIWTALVLNTTYQAWHHVTEQCVVEKIEVHVDTAPSGGPCVVQLLRNGAPIQTATIADGTDEATSSDGDVTLNAGDELQVRTTTIWTADKLSVTLVGKKQVLAS